MRQTQVAIIGSGPSGLVLSQLLHNVGISSIIIDRQDRDHIEGRIRAGVLEPGTVDVLREAGVGGRMDREGLLHDGFELAFGGKRHRIDLYGLVGKKVMVYGQTELTKDLFDLGLQGGAEIIFDVSSARISDPKADRPEVHFEKNGKPDVIHCDFIAGCDGFHGISRKSIPADILKTYERVYPFGWLGLLTERPPISNELLYINHERGFALCSMRSKTRSRYYLQCDAADGVMSWSDDRFWEELSIRIGNEAAANLECGPSFEKSIVPLRSFVAEPMRYGNLFLAGDAAHIVPPTGAKGLNLAIFDVHLLARAFDAHYNAGKSDFLDTYSTTCLARVWKAARFSWYLSTLMHQFPQHSAFEKKMQRAEFDYITGSEAASRAIAENYVGLPLEI